MAQKEASLLKLLNITDHWAWQVSDIRAIKCATAFPRFEEIGELSTSLIVVMMIL